MTNPTPHGQVPEALRLADLLLNLQTHMGPRRPSHPDDAHCWDGYTQASAELRRLHAENEALRAQPAGAATPAAPGVPNWLQYDQHTDVLTIHGKRYAAGMFGESGFLAPPGTLLRVEQGHPDCVTLSKVAEGEPSGTAEAVDALQAERERICAAIKAEDDYCVDQGGYMLDSDDCIKIVRGDWVRPDFSVRATHQGDHK